MKNFFFNLVIDHTPSPVGLEITSSFPWRRFVPWMAPSTVKTPFNLRADKNSLPITQPLIKKIPPIGSRYYCLTANTDAQEE
jgi:hypothetical protein